MHGVPSASPSGHRTDVKLDSCGDLIGMPPFRMSSSVMLLVLRYLTTGAYRPFTEHWRTTHCWLKDAGVRREIATDLLGKHFPDDPEGWRRCLMQVLSPHGPVFLEKIAECDWDLGRLEPCEFWCPTG